MSHKIKHIRYKEFKITYPVGRGVKFKYAIAKRLPEFGDDFFDKKFRLQVNDNIKIKETVQKVKKYVDSIANIRISGLSHEPYRNVVTVKGVSGWKANGERHRNADCFYIWNGGSMMAVINVDGTMLLSCDKKSHRYRWIKSEEFGGSVENAIRYAFLMYKQLMLSKRKVKDNFERRTVT